MGRKKNRASDLRWCSLLASLAFLTAVNSSDSVELPVCSKLSSGKRFLMLVSTLDGRISALNVNEHGKPEWGLNAGPKPLLSSSISKLEIQRDGIPIKLIPSLDGKLYQFDGESIESVPFSADSLLSSSFKLSDNSMVVGGKETRTYGIDAKTGKVRYLCSPAGCEVCGEDAVTEKDDIMVVRRNTQTVRAVDSKTGYEKWNFSVGQHELEFLEGIQPGVSSLDEDDDDDVTITTCSVTGEEIPDVATERVKNPTPSFIVLPSGLIVAVDKDNPSNVLWQHKFESPIASAWTLKGNHLEQIDVLDGDRNSQDFRISDNKIDMEPLPPAPVMYLGMHQNQLYVQPSVKTTVFGTYGQNMPKLRWRPLIATSPSRTPVININDEANTPLLDFHGRDQNAETEVQAVSVWHQGYPYDNGYFLYSDGTTAPMPDPLKRQLDFLNLTNLSSTGEYDGSFTVSLWNWWKEVAAISILTAVLFHLFITKYVVRSIMLENLKDEQMNEKLKKEGSKSSGSLQESLDRQDSNESVVGDKGLSTTQGPFVSRFYSDFDQLACLGKGGFGVVFETKNKVDDNHYAIKRISLPNSTDAKEKVMREVKALAKLDHGGIVRYFQAWLESPPPGWQEERDVGLLDSDTTTISQTPYSGTYKKDLLKTSSPVDCPIGSSRSLGFVPHKEDIDNDESGSFSVVGTPHTMPHFHTKTSVDFDLDTSDSDSENDILDNLEAGLQDVPFQVYQEKQLDVENVDFDNSNDSLNIVFEDSGCEEKSNSDSVFCAETSSCDYTNSESGQLRNVIVSKESHSPISSSFTLHSSKPSRTEKRKDSSLPKMYLYIQMQLCKKETLKDWLNSNTLNRNHTELMRIFVQIVDAVEYVHGMGLMHRDLKPSNIFFSLDGTIKVGDFGLVTAMAEYTDTLVDNEEDEQGKHTNQVGTTLYMSPEQIAGKSYSHKVDIYAMGLIFFELFYPFSTQMERVVTLQNIRQLNFPERFSRELGEECQFVKWLLMPKPEERPEVTEILESPLMKNFEQTMHNQLKRNRSRTISTSSS